MRVATIARGDETIWGVLEEEHLLDARDLAPSLREFLAAGGTAATLAEHRGPDVALADTRWLPPVPDPTKIWCCGLNYQDYQQMLGLEFLPAPATFLKAPSALVGHDAQVGVPKGYGSVFDEWELTAVVGRTISGATPDEARAAIFGWTIMHDLVLHELELTSREYQQWAKNADGFAPCGPWIVTADDLDVDRGVTMRRYQNGELVSESSTREMRRQPGEIAAFISNFSTLLPGDLVATGTPPTGACHAGDVIEGEIDGIGVLRAELVDREVDAQWQSVMES